MIWKPSSICHNNTVRSSRKGSEETGKQLYLTGRVQHYSAEILQINDGQVANGTAVFTPAG